MADDYEQAAARHFKNALALRNAGEVDNAGHLVGFAAECAIKFGITSLRPGEASPHVHLPELLAAARKKFHGRGTKVGMYHIVKDNHFDTWHVNRRYAETNSTTSSELESWFLIARRLLAAAGVRGLK